MIVPRRVLCVEDERCFADAFRLAIDVQPDLTCVGVAGTVAEGVAAVVKLRPDVIVVDVLLPDGSGIEVARRAKGLGDVLVIVLTGHADAGNLVAAADAGADGFLPKNASLDDVLAAVRRRDRGLRLDATNVVAPLDHGGDRGAGRASHAP